VKDIDSDLHSTSNSIDVFVQTYDVAEAKCVLVKIYVAFPESKRNEKTAGRLFARAFELVGQVGKKAGAIGFAEVIRELIRILRE